MSKITCTSPIDGSVYVEKDVQSKQEIESLLYAARKAQLKWAETDLMDRISLVKAAVSKLEDMNDDIVIEIAHQMGKLVIGAALKQAAQPAVRAQIVGDLLAPRSPALEGQG